MSKCRQFIGCVHNYTVDNYNDRPDSFSAEPFLFGATLDYNRRRSVVDPGRGLSDLRARIFEYPGDWVLRARSIKRDDAIGANFARTRREIARARSFFCEPTRSSVIPSVVGFELITTRLGRD